MGKLIQFPVVRTRRPRRAVGGLFLGFAELAQHDRQQARLFAAFSVLGLAVMAALRLALF
jgi:hypothetical protein